MFFKTLLAVCVALIPLTSATPIALEKRAMAKYVEEVTIHSSCNTTQRRQLTKALSDTWELVSMAKEYTYTNGANDSLYELYFGDGPITNVIGAFDAVLKSNKDGVLLRCDDIDGNCRLPGWRGHWRGENGTAETVSIGFLSNDMRTLTDYCIIITRSSVMHLIPTESPTISSARLDTQSLAPLHLTTSVQICCKLTSYVLAAMCNN